MMLLMLLDVGCMARQFLVVTLHVFSGFFFLSPLLHAESLAL